MMQLFSESQINQLGKSFRINHDIFRFEISKYDIMSMEMTDGIENSSNIEHCSMIIKSPITSQSRKQFSTLDILEHHVDMLGVLEC